MKKFLYICLPAGLVVYLFDRIIKIFLLKNPNYTWDFLNHLLGLHLATNYGIAFSLTLNKYLIIVVSVITILILFLAFNQFLYQKKYHLASASYLIILGAISNLADRFRFGFVVDYIDVSFFTVFNLADCLITVRVIIFLIDLFFLNRVDKK